MKLKTAKIGNNTSIRHSVANTIKIKIGHEVTIGPFAHTRPQSLIGDEVRVGNFVRN